MALSALSDGQIGYINPGQLWIYTETGLMRLLIEPRFQTRQGTEMLRVAAKKDPVLGIRYRIYLPDTTKYRRWPQRTTWKNAQERKLISVPTVFAMKKGEAPKRMLAAFFFATEKK